VANHKHRKTYDPVQPPQLPTFGTTPIVVHTLTIVFRLSRPRTWAFPAVGFLLGYTLASGAAPFQMGLGLCVAALVTAATNIVNAYADRKEDTVNQPRRVFWLDQIGSSGAVTASVLLYISAVALGLFLGPLFLIVLAVGIFNSIFYSMPPFRFKARPLPSLISFSGSVGLAFLSGVSIQGSVNLLNPVFWLITYFMLTYGTVKNLPDYTGDKKAGTRTSATIFHTIKNAVSFSGILLLTPYVLLLALVASGALATIYLADLIMLAILAFILQGILKAKNSERLEHLHTLGFFYAISFLLVTLALASATLQSLAIITGVYLWILLVSRVNFDSRIETRDWEKQKR
jgi:4-hydroxybenzoate polyprenyltransferase